MQQLGYIFIVLGFVDYGAGILGVNIYEYFGIHLTGYAYEYSPYAAGLVGGVLIALGKNKDISHQFESSLNTNENVIFKKLVSVRKGGFFSAVEVGTFFLTNQRIGYVGNFSQKGEELNIDDTGAYDFSCPLKNIKSVRGTLTSVEISHDEGTFKFEPGITKVKEVVDQIEKQMESSYKEKGVLDENYKVE